MNNWPATRAVSAVSALCLGDGEFLVVGELLLVGVLFLIGVLLLTGELLFVCVFLFDEVLLFAGDLQIGLDAFYKGILTSASTLLSPSNILFIFYPDLQQASENPSKFRSSS
ncbi:MAG: hypothetical protein EZS28_025336 [Streblomastix strix]|uniref:Uncharacterized protein n=1 Tax=Streblomastix strix TaxID=222440 RepID=A0A5J4V9G0_9EUKA|nr:MAG: hypothetical protein EZS28_025336 [Streblomastix strix]